MSTPTSRHARLVPLLKVAAGLAILLLALRAVPWGDSVRLRAQQGEVAVPGRILGDWSGERAEFLIAAEAQERESWPPGWSEARDAGRPLELVRDLEHPGEGALDWRPGLRTVFSGLGAGALAAGFGLFLAGIAITVFRWWRLLVLAGCGTRFLTVFRLTFLGLFFNLVVPGLTGGDLIKVVLAVREHPDRRPDAFASAVVDRALGLTALLLLTSLFVLLGGERLAPFRVPVLALALVALAGLVLLVHPAPRRLVRLDRWIRRLPQGERLESLDRAARLYGSHPVELAIALALSIANSLCNAAGIFLFAVSMGSPLGYGDTLAAASVASIASAVPLSPGGLGVEEAAYALLFATLGATASVGLAVGLTKRACFTLIGLAGGLFLLAPGGAALRREASAPLTTP